MAETEIIMKKFMVVLLLAAAAVVALGTYFYKGTDEYKTQKEIAGQIIRFHVRANSDSEEDQRLKLAVKDAVVLFLKDELSGAKDLDEARNILYYDIDRIEEIAGGVIADMGYEYNVSVYFEKSYFPMKVYGDMSFPPGEYEAFRVDIGGAEGKNWWCVLFPPLCFVDSAYSVVPDDTKEQFRNVLSEDAYEAITLGDLDGDNYRIRFKFLKFLNKFFE